MKKIAICLAALFVLSALSIGQEAQAGGLYYRMKKQLHYPGYTHADAYAARNAALRPWHANYAHVQYGRPVALVVPPTANAQTNWNWGVTGTTVTPIYHQFARPYPTMVDPQTGQIVPAPAVPSSTEQFGVYYIRAPW